MNIPSREQCLDILTKNKTPSTVIDHTKEVCKVAEDIAEKLLKKGIKLNKELVTAGALLHDVEKEKDDHVIEGANLLKRLGFPEVSTVIYYLFEGLALRAHRIGGAVIELEVTIIVLLNS